MIMLGQAILMYAPHSRSASPLQPGHVQRPGSWRRVTRTQQPTMSASDVACTQSHAHAAPSRP